MPTTAIAPELATETPVIDGKIRRMVFPSAAIREVKVTVDGVEKDAIEAVINTNDVDRFETVVEPKGADLTNFRDNPILLWAHGNDFSIGSWPVGTVAELDVTEKEIIARIVFDTEGELGAELDRLYRAKILRGFSIGFIPKAFVSEQPESDGPEIIRFTEWELVELSAVAVPANPSALAKQLEDGTLSFRTADLGRVIHLGLVRSDLADPTKEERELLLAKESIKAKAIDVEDRVATISGEADKVAKELASDGDPLPVALGETTGGDAEDIALTAGLAQLDRLAESAESRGGGPSVPHVPGVPGSAPPVSSTIETIESARAALTGSGDGDFPDGDLSKRFRELQQQHLEGAAMEIGKPADVDPSEMSPDARAEVVAMEFILNHIEGQEVSARREKAATESADSNTTIEIEHPEGLADEVADLRKLVLLQAEQVAALQGIANKASDLGYNGAHERERKPRKYLTKAGREALSASADGLEETARFLKEAAKTMKEQSGIIRDAIEIVSESVESSDDAGDGDGQDDRDSGPVETEQIVDAAPEFIRELVAAEVSNLLGD